MRRSEIRRAMVAGWKFWKNDSVIERYLGLPPAEQRRYVSLVLELSGTKPDGQTMTEAQAIAITNVCIHLEQQETSDIIFRFLNSTNGSELIPPRKEITASFTPADSPTGPTLASFLLYISEDLKDPAFGIAATLSDYRAMFFESRAYRDAKNRWRQQTTVARGKAVSV